MISVMVQVQSWQAKVFNFLSSVYTKMEGVVDGVYYCNMNRTLELSNRMAARNVPSAPLQPQYSIRPVSTKYALMPILDRRAPTYVPIKQEPTYEVNQGFNPGTAQAPWSGFASNINTESVLRSQFFGLQRCEQGEYIPDSKGDLYSVKAVGRPARQPFPGLFKKEVLAAANMNPCGLGTHLFNNHTRVQVMDLPMDGKKMPLTPGI